MNHTNLLQNWIGKTIDTILPPRCLVTGAQVDIQGMVAPDAWAKLSFITAPFCRCCGVPFPFAAGGENCCVSCLREPPPYDSSRSVLVYDDTSRDIILRFKHGDQTHTLPTLAAWLHRAAGDMPENAGLIVPVPLHRYRLLKRRYNQAALLAQRLARLSALPCLPDALLRQRPTPSQGHLGFKERHRNVKKAFAVNPRHKERLNGQAVILVDDVYTSGATVKECAKVLRAAGAARIDVLTLARVVRAE